ncbi:MAG: ABC transporter ATP-binding protein [Fimbriimonadaceae bacterium]|nr:ABC transporter ATP-binding protein [Fimbriimonadaceae bacterium]QYK57098.1 MAG: ABC transporter ATP-binding protein [Fimbriimonadaceae bacterium]
MFDGLTDFTRRAASMVTVRDVRKAFEVPKKPPIQALTGVDLTAEPGRVHGLLGVNGAGKTTLLRILATVIRADSGTATVQGFDVGREPEKVRASIGFLSGSTAVYGRLNPVETLRYFGSLCGMSEEALDKRVGYVVERFGIDSFSDQLCEKLSTGQKQRVGIARAILHDPPVVFFDEPTSGLDVVTKQGVMEFIEECREIGKTVVFSTHVMSEADRVCDDVTIIHDGKVLAAGTKEEFLRQHGAVALEPAFLAAVGYGSAVKA